MRNEDVDPGRRSRPFVRDVLPVARAYKIAADAKGLNSLHIVLDDGNVDDWHILAVIDDAEAAHDAEGLELARQLLGLSRSNRRRVYRGVWSS